MAFQPGQSGNPAGRPKGSRNIKDHAWKVFEKLGGSEGIYKWIYTPDYLGTDSKGNKLYQDKSAERLEVFYGWMMKMLPKELEVNGDAVTVNVMPTIKVEVPDINDNGTTEDIRRTPKAASVRFEI